MYTQKQNNKDMTSFTIVADQRLSNINWNIIKINICLL